MPFFISSVNDPCTHGYINIVIEILPVIYVLATYFVSFVR